MPFGQYSRAPRSDTIGLIGEAPAFLAMLEHVSRAAKLIKPVLVIGQLGRFRADLLGRLAFDVVHVPPLRARPEDVHTLAYHFAVNVTKELRRSFFEGLTADAKAALLAYGWPGNVRELKNAVERSVYRTEAAVETTVPNDFRAAVASFERQVLRRALERAQFKQTLAAKILGLSYRQFRSLLRKHGLAKPGNDNGD